MLKTLIFGLFTVLDVKFFSFKFGDPFWTLATLKRVATPSLRTTAFKTKLE
jgi:hypothetical protein